MDGMQAEIKEMGATMVANNQMVEAMRAHLVEALPLQRGEGTRRQLLAPPMLPSTSHISDVSTDDTMGVSEPASPPPPSDPEDEISDGSESAAGSGAEDNEENIEDEL